jgi:hypothetical protein
MGAVATGGTGAQALSHNTIAVRMAGEIKASRDMKLGSLCFKGWQFR